MIDQPLAPYLYWAKTRPAAAIDLAGSNLLACTLDDLPGAHEALALTAPDHGGFPPLVEAIAAHYGAATDRVVTAPGCSAANFLAIGALVGPGDTVLMESPWYDQITGACRLVGANVRHFERKFEDGYRIDVAALRAEVTPRTALIIISSPHNPSGLLVDNATIEALQAMAESTGTFVLVDEVYLDATNLVGSRLRDAPRAVGRYRPAALVGDRLLSASSLTKSYGLGGLRCGWLVAPPAIAERARRVRDVIDNIGAAPADRLSALAFSLMDQLSARTSRLVATNLDLVRQFLARHPQLQVAGEPEATIVFPRFEDGRGCDAFVERLFAEHGVAVAVGRFFGAPAHFRISLGGATGALEAGLGRVSTMLVM